MTGKVVKNLIMFFCNHSNFTEKYDVKNTAITDRYISFNGITCDDHAQRIVSALHICIADPACPTPWQTYFVTKLDEIARRGQDELYFVGSQVNAIRELFTHYNDTDALQLLEQVEEECC
jgi:hypothetical protein